MCGIIGYLGSKEVVPILLDGLRRLEYRGYDSRGVAVVRNGQIERRRSAGKLVESRAGARQQPLEGVYGVGHTRGRRTAGPPRKTRIPHQDCTGKIVVVHNGIIENYLDLKHELQKVGHKFVTETDSKSSRICSSRNEDGRRSRTRRGRRCSHARPVRVRARSRPTIRKRSSPSATARRSSWAWATASSSSRPTRRRFSATRATSCFLGDEEMAVITRRGVEFTNFAGTPVSKATQRVLWDPVMAEKSGYRHFMLKEIFEQPRAAEETLLGRVSSNRQGVPRRDRDLGSRAPRHHQSARWSPAARRGTRPLVANSSSSGSRAAGRGRLRLRVPLPRLHRRSQHAGRHHHAVRRDGRHARRASRSAKKGARSLAICNVVGSMATRESEGTIYTHAGPEIGVALDQGLSRRSSWR
jgi:glucosamine--fructose-6-phosphate aminotransferase (isomerizing)